jgi:ATP-dependent Clp protease ATP-binding subunit ClpA
MVREVLIGCSADPNQLGVQLREHVAANTLRRVPFPGEVQPVHPQLGLQRVLQRAVLHAKSSGQLQVGVVDVLVSIFSEKQSQAVFLMKRQGVTRTVVVDYVMSLKSPP